MTPNRSYNKTSTANWGCFIKQEFGGVGVVIYDLFEVIYYDLIYGTGLRWQDFMYSFSLTTWW